MSAGLKEGERGIVFDGQTHDGNSMFMVFINIIINTTINSIMIIMRITFTVQVMWAILGLCLGFKWLPLLLFLPGDYHLDEKYDDYVYVGGIDDGDNDTNVMINPQFVFYCN